jgi:hypothetical protein
MSFIQAASECDEILKEHKTEVLIGAITETVGSSPIFDPYRGSRQDRALLKNFSSSLIDRYINAASLRERSSGDVFLHIDDEKLMEVKLLKVDCTPNSEPR